MSKMNWTVKPTTKWIATALLGAGVSFASSLSAMAQIQVQIGGSTGQIKRVLINNGYDQIDVYHQGLKLSLIHI